MPVGRWLLRVDDRVTLPGPGGYWVLVGGLRARVELAAPGCRGPRLVIGRRPFVA